MYIINYNLNREQVDKHIRGLITSKPGNSKGIVDWTLETAFMYERNHEKVFMRQGLSNE